MKLPRGYWFKHSQLLYHGAAQEKLAALPSGFVNCVVTSPPYFGLRDYGVDGQIGLEPSPAEYVEALRKVFSEIERVLDPRGTVWLNIGDSYGRGGGLRKEGDTVGPNSLLGKKLHTPINMSRPMTPGFAPKTMLGIPWRIAFALQDDGWILRNDIIWHKPNAMPSSVTDRLNNRYEHVFLFTKSQHYDFDLDSIREPLTYPDRTGHTFGGNKQEGRTTATERHVGAVYEPSDRGKNPGDVWSISTAPYRGAHFATFPPKLVERCLKAGCPEGGIVLDPFCGSGTVGMVSRRLGLRSIGIDLNSEYLDLAAVRIEGGK